MEYAVGLPMGSGQIASYQFEHIQTERFQKPFRFCSDLIP